MLDRAFPSGSPVYGAYTRGMIGTGTNTPSAGDTNLQTRISAWNAGSDYKVYESGYPSLNSGALTVTLRMFVTSTQANSNSITEYADVNSDAGAYIGGRFVFTAITKTSGIQVYFSPRYRFS